MSNDFISHHTSLAFRVLLTCIFLIALYIYYTQTSQESFFLTWASQVRTVVSLLSRNCLLHRLHLQTAPRQPPRHLPLQYACPDMECIIRTGLPAIPLLAKQLFIGVWSFVWHLFDAGAPAFVSMNHLSAKVMAFQAGFHTYRKGCLWCEWSQACLNWPAPPPHRTPWGNRELRPGNVMLIQDLFSFVRVYPVPMHVSQALLSRDNIVNSPLWLECCC